MRTFLVLAMMFFLIPGCVFRTNQEPQGPQGQSDYPDYSLAPNFQNPDDRSVRDIPYRMTGSIRLIGVLNSVGGYYVDERKPDDIQGSSLKSTFWDFGRGGENIGWFFADIDTKGNILYARVYFYGYHAGVKMIGDLRNPVNGSYGRVTNSSWEINVSGPSNLKFIQDQPIISTGSVSIRGSGDILNGVRREKFPGQYVMNFNPNMTSFMKKPKAWGGTNWKDMRRNCDYGTTTTFIIR